MLAQITAEPPLADSPPAAMAVPSPSKTAAPAESARIEIALPDGTCIRVGADLATLRRVITAVRR
jgi:transposase